MTLPIFWRILFGYSAILILSIGLSSYCIVQLGSVSGAARTALNVDNRMIAYEEKLVDALLSEVRYGKKYVITQAVAQYEQSGEFKNDFTRYLNELTALAESPEIRSRLARVREFHVRYSDLFEQEVQYLNRRQTYAVTRYRQEKENVIDRILAELEQLKVNVEKNVLVKLERIEQSAQLIRRVAFLTTLALLMFGAALSFVISKSLTQAIYRLKRKIVEAGDRNSDPDTAFAHIPEIQDLADALTQWKKQRHEAAFITISQRSMRPLISIREQAHQLRNQIAERVSIEQKKKLDILAYESERLIHLFSEPAAIVTPIANDQQTSIHATDETASPDDALGTLKSFVIQGARKGKVIVAAIRNVIRNTMKDSISTMRYGKEKK